MEDRTKVLVEKMKRRSWPGLGNFMFTAILIFLCFLVTACSSVTIFTEVFLENTTQTEISDEVPEERVASENMPGNISEDPSEKTGNPGKSVIPVENML